MAQPTEDEINDVLNACMESEDSGESIYPGMTYEQGVMAGIQWMQGEVTNPIKE